MSSQEFVIWLKGFVAGSNNYNLTPQGWEAVKENLARVSDAEKVSINFGPSGTPLNLGPSGTPLNLGPSGTSTATTLPPGVTVSYSTNDKIFLYD